jgi:phenylpropionate dioxygenase-like ring-hydroxylating dioxygenase large terminal subunit
MSFEEYFGDVVSSLDNIADRSPEGEVEVAGGCLRYVNDCNWKIITENHNDTMHPMVTHESSAGEAKKVGAKLPEGTEKPMIVELLAPFASDYEFFDAGGMRVFENGHSYDGEEGSIHKDYLGIPEYDRAIVQAYGKEKAEEIIGEQRHNTVMYPTLNPKCAVQIMRVARPISVNKTLVESWTFRLKGAPDELLHRTQTFSRFINSPFSMVGHDDVHCYEAVQEGLRASGNEWVSLHRDYDPDEAGERERVDNGTSEITIRNQFRAWFKFMLEGMMEDARREEQ